MRSLAAAAAPAVGADATVAARRGGVVLRKEAATAVLPIGKTAESKRMHSSASSVRVVGKW